MSVKTTPTNQFIDLVSDDLSASSGLSGFSGEADVATYGGTEWDTVSKIK